MLVLQRTVGSSILMHDGVNYDMRIKVIDIFHDYHRGMVAKLGFEFPESYKILREEVSVAMHLGMTLPEARRHITQLDVFGGGSGDNV